MTSPDNPEGCTHGAAALGNIFNPTDPNFLRHSDTFYAQARYEAPIFYASRFGCFIVTSRELIVKVLADPAQFSNRYALTPPMPFPEPVLEVLRTGYLPAPTLVTTDPPVHTRLRTLFTTSLAPARVAQLEPRIRALAEELINAFGDTGQTDLVSMYALPLPLLVITQLLGVPRSDVTQVKSWHDDFLRLYSSTAGSLEQQLVCARGLVAYQRYYEALIEERRRNPGDDLVSALLQARLAGEAPYSTEELIWELIVLLSAGHESSAGLVSGTAFHLLQNRQLWDASAADPGTLTAVVEETLRFAAPIQMMTRTTTSEVELGGVVIPAGGRVFLSFAAANREPGTTATPEEWNPQLPQGTTHLSFGWGIHYCIGASLGRLEARVALSVLRERLPKLRLAADYDAAFAPSFLFKNLAQLSVRWD